MNSVPYGFDSISDAQAEQDRLLAASAAKKRKRDEKNKTLLTVTDVTQLPINFHLSLNPHTRLGLPPNVTFEEVKKQYKKIARVWHPDKGGDVEVFRKVKESYEELKVKFG